MAFQRHQASGKEALDLTTRLLQRARAANPHAGVFEAADFQWSWRKSRESDSVEQLFWSDDHGPVAGVLLTSEADGSWQCVPTIVTGAVAIEFDQVWTEAMRHITHLQLSDVSIPVGSEDQTLTTVVERLGLVPVDRDSTGWMEVDDRPSAIPIPPVEGFVIADRQGRLELPHHMQDRNGDEVQTRLLQCSLYDPSLDLVVETTEGTVAGYSLYWFDPVTRVGLVEPVRVESNYQRKGLARAMLTLGIERLKQKGARRIKVSWETDVAGALYLGNGFQKTSTTTWYQLPETMLTSSTATASGS